MAVTHEYCKDVDGVSDIMEQASRQRETLRKEVEKYCGERGVPAAAHVAPAPVQAVASVA